jgi:dCMP deaminase
MNNKKIKRPDWDEYFLKVAMLVAERSTCRRHHIGAVIVRNKRILSTGYNGAASGMKDCLELGCLRDELKIPSGTRHEICRAIHAEQNAIIQAGLHGTKIEGATMYITHFPCMICAKMIVNSKINKLVVYSPYPDKMALNFLKKAGVVIKRMKKPSGKIESLD